MICLERDAKELGFGGGGRREMDDTELEEGEACSYNNNHNDNDDASVDPDIDLSYLDEKIQDLLGPFQKDFEGGVSAENLGAKFGGYGSFLRTYPRSPMWPKPRTPPKTQQNNVPKSPNNLQPEGGRRSSIFSSNAPQSLRLESASVSLASVPASKASSSLIDSAKKEVCMSSTDFAAEVPSKLESVNKRYANLPDSKMLKVRIKMGPDNLSTQNNAAIYSGLGLDVSPSSSLDDSPSESEEISHEPQDTPFASPANIIRIMTSFPVHGFVLLSPLPDDLLHLMDMEKLPKDSGSLAVPRVGPQGSGILVNGSDSVKVDKKISGGKYKKLPQRIEMSTNSKGENIKDSVNIDSSTCEELVSNISKIPIVSNSHPANGDMGKGMGRDFNISKGGNKGAMKDTIFSDLTKEEQLVRNFKQEDGLIDNPKSSLGGKFWEEKKSSSVDSTSLHSQKDGRHKGEKPDDYVKMESSSLMGKSGLNSEPTDLPKEKDNQKIASYDQEGMKLPPGKDSSSSEGKKKTKGSQGKAKVSADKFPKESSRAGSSSTSKSKKSTYEDNYNTEGELGDIKSQKQTGKSKDRYRDFFGDIELEHENRMSPSEMSSEEERVKDLDVVEKITHATSNFAREKSSGKKPDKQLMSEPYPKAALSVPPPAAVNGSVGDATPAAVAPVVTKENWVGCDQCQKWRLLPLGKNTQDLPEKWLCSMLNWLPGMNKCSFSEEETTNALRALYHVPAPVSQSNLHSNIDGSGIVSTATFADAQQPDQNQQSFGSHAMPAGGKKKHVLKEFSNLHYKDGTSQFLNSTKKMTETSVSINDGKRSATANEPDYMKLSKSNDKVVEKNKHKKKEKHKGLDNRSDEGDTKRSKVKAKRDLDPEFSRASKKIRNDALAENWMPDHPGPSEKSGPTLTNGLINMSSGKNLPNYNDHASLKDSKHDQKGWVHVSAPKDKAQVSLHGSMDVGKQNNGNVSKKRKSKENHSGQPRTGSLLNSDNHVQDRILEKEECDDNEYKKEKKARISRFDGKESSTSKGSGRSDKKGGHRRSQPPGQDVGSTFSHRSLDGVDSLKRDCGTLHAAAAATSSSSKVSGSHKSKANFHETKGSPVESVSSSPMRVLNTEKLTSARRNLAEKDDSPEPRLLPLGEDDGGSGRSGTTRKEKTLDAGNHGSLESAVLDFQEKESNHASFIKAKAQIVSSPDLTNHQFTNGSADYEGINSRYSSKSKTSDRRHDDERQNSQHHVNASSSKKSVKGSSSRSKDKLKNFYSESESGVMKMSDSTNEQASGGELKSGNGKNKIDEKILVKSDENENMNVAKKDSERLLFSDNGKKERNSNAGDAKVDAIGVQDPTSTAKQSLHPHGEMAPKREKSNSTLPSRGAQNDAADHCPQPASESCKENGINSLAVNASHGDNALKVPKKNREVEHQNGIHQNSTRNPSSSSHRVKDLDARSPVKRDSVSQAANNAVKEAKNLKHMADRLKNSGSTESTRLYFEAALKFLNGASLLESNGNENGRTGDVIQSMQMYSSTAKLCEFCAHECERSKDMATAALAYKCMEVAYMRVIYSSHASANRDRHELQTALQVNPPGESPSSSASDVDNLNHPTTADKVPLAKGISSPQVAGNHIIAARHRPNFVRLLNFAHDVNFAMEASRKSRIAFAEANLSLGEDQRRETIKRALDFNFQDVEGLLRLVRLAIEAISSQK